MGTLNNNLLPSATGLDLGSSDQQWDANIQTLNVYGDSTFSGPINGNAKELNTIRFADQYGGFTAASIQGAIDDCPAGGTVFLPEGDYDCSANLPITINKSLRFVGAGWGANLHIGASVGSSTDIILVRPQAGSIIYGLTLENFQISPVSGTPGRYGINFDGTFDSAYLPVVRHVRITQLGSYLIYGSGDGNSNGIPHCGLIDNCFLTSYVTAAGCISFTTAGDTLVIRNSKMEGNGYALDYSGHSGASNLIFRDNNVSSWKGIHLGSNVVSPIIEDNELESTSQFTGSNGAFIDIDGTSGSHVSGGAITGNVIRMINGITANCIRVNYADTVRIEGNDLARGGAPAKDIVITANASNTQVGTNLWRSGTPFSSMIDNSGANTIPVFMFTGNSFVIGNDCPISWIDDAGTQRNVLITGTDGTVVGYGYHGTQIYESGGGAHHLFDNVGNIGLNIWSGFTAPSSSSYVSTPHLKAFNDITVGSGTAITQMKIYSQSLDVGSVAANTSAEQDFTVTGLTTADRVFVNKPSLSAGLVIGNVRVKAADTLSITFGNLTGSPIDPGAETYEIVAIRS